MSRKNGSEKRDSLIIFLENSAWAWHRGGNLEVIRETLKLSS